MIKRLRLKFIFINMTIVTAILCVIFGLILYSTSTGMERESLEMMRNVATRPHKPDIPGDRDPGMPMSHFTLELNESGDWIVANSGNFDLSDPSLVNDLITLSEDDISGTIKEYGLRFLHITDPGICRIVFSDISREVAMIQNLAMNCVLIGISAFCVFLLISILLAHWAVKPVAVAWEQQRQFVADASHELKTPLTVILSNAQMLADNGDDPVIREKLTNNILAVSDQMKDLVGKLLRSAQVDQGREAMILTPVDLSETVNASMLPFDAIFYEQEKELRGDIADNIRVRGSRTHLVQVVDILLDNARKYSNEQGRTWVTLQRQGAKHCLLTVASEGAPMTSGELKDVFKRFYRGDTARERKGSYGLGLSIAEGIVKAHGGRIWAESSGGINSFIVKLPLMNA